uniref:Polyprotein allergen nematode domain-containing protein n=1 Tax=Caenorhabditis japonica TaxID=281687 RepID=A0A8R1HJW1_CAEJA
MHSKFNEFRDAALHLATESFSESVDCIDKLSADIDKYNDYVKLKVPATKSSLGEMLDNEQINQLHQLLAKTKRADLVEKGLHQHFHGMPEKRRQELLAEFFASKPARAKRSTMSKVIAREPNPLPSDMLSWKTPRHKNVLRKLKNSGTASQWDIMNALGDQYYHLRKSIRAKFDKKFLEYCNSNILNIIGNDSFALLETMYHDSEQTEHIWNKYQQIIGYLRNEEDQLTAEHYGHFCRKIYRLVPIEQADLMSWLSPGQKFKIAEMIQDTHVNDSQVYEKLYEFFNQATGDAKDEADEVITLGCRKFIAHHLGDQVAEDIEDLRVANDTGSSHYTAALLSVKHSEVEAAGELAHQKRIDAKSVQRISVSTKLASVLRTCRQNASATVIPLNAWTEYVRTVRTIQSARAVNFVMWDSTEIRRKETIVSNALALKTENALITQVQTGSNVLIVQRIILERGVKIVNLLISHSRRKLLQSH